MVVALNSMGGRINLNLCDLTYIYALHLVTFREGKCLGWPIEEVFFVGNCGLITGDLWSDGLCTPTFWGEFSVFKRFGEF